MLLAKLVSACSGHKSKTMRDYESIIRRLVSDASESPKVDFKTTVDLANKSDVAELAKLCLAFANTDSDELDNIGYVIVGARRGEVLGGVDALGNDSICASIPTKLNLYIAPEASIEVKPFRDEQRGWFGAILVRPSRAGARPHLVKKTYSDQKYTVFREHDCWVRRGESVCLASREDFDRMFEQRHAERSRAQEAQLEALRMEQADSRQQMAELTRRIGLVFEAVTSPLRADGGRTPMAQPEAIPTAEAGASNVPPPPSENGKIGEPPSVAVPRLDAFFRLFLRRSLNIGNNSKRSEVKAWLKAAYTAMRAYEQEFDRYPPSFAEAGFAPIAGSRWVYFLSDDETAGGDAIPERDAFILAARAKLEALGVHPHVSESDFLVAAVAQLEGESALDVWTIDRSGEPNDVTKNY